jgi:hypothetical protein
MTWKAVCKCGVVFQSIEATAHPEKIICQCGRRMAITIYVSQHADAHETPEEKEWKDDVLQRVADSQAVDRLLRSMKGWRP